MLHSVFTLYKNIFLSPKEYPYRQLIKVQIILSFFLTNSMWLNPYWESFIHLVKKSNLSWHHMVYYHVHTSLLLLTKLRQMNPVHTLLSSLFLECPLYYYVIPARQNILSAVINILWLNHVCIWSPMFLQLSLQTAFELKFIFFYQQMHHLLNI